MIEIISITLVAAATLLSAASLYFLLGKRGIEMFQEYRQMFTEGANVSMRDMVMVANPQRLFYANVIAMIVLPIFVGLVTRDFIIAGVIFVLIAALPQIMYRSMQKKRLVKFEQQLPDAMAMLAGSLRAGASLSIAIDSMVREMPPPISHEFELFLREQKLGADFDTAITHMEHRVPVLDFQLVIAALRISREVGGNLTEVMDSMADTLRKKHMMEGKIKSLTAQGKMQGIVMAFLPIFLGIILMFIEPEAMGKMFTTEYGWVTLGVIVIMEFLGFLTIKKITSIDV